MFAKHSLSKLAILSAVLMAAPVLAAGTGGAPASSSGGGGGGGGHGGGLGAHAAAGSTHVGAGSAASAHLLPGHAAHAMLANTDKHKPPVMPTPRPPNRLRNNYHDADDGAPWAFNAPCITSTEYWSWCDRPTKHGPRS
jgi:hypothetical protein